MPIHVLIRDHVTGGSHQRVIWPPCWTVWQQQQCEQAMTDSPQNRGFSLPCGVGDNSALVINPETCNPALRRRELMTVDWVGC